jgi:hypothetical protein
MPNDFVPGGAELIKQGASIKEVRAAMAHMRKRILRLMRAHGAYLFHSAATGSQYVKFKVYRYKWNLIHGGERGTLYEGKVKREYYGFQDVEQFLLDFELAQGALEQAKGVYDPEKDPYRDSRTRKRDTKERR